MKYNQSMRLLSLASVSLLCACGSSDNNEKADGSVTPQVDAGQQITADAKIPSTGTWTIASHPCGSTDALFCDSLTDCFVGCGTSAEGNIGAHQTTSSGQSWGTVVDQALGTMRVNDISRSSDGLLYLAGSRAGTASRVVSVDSAGAVSEVWNTQNTVDYSFTAGSFRRNSNGYSIVESLTGAGIVYRKTDGGDTATSWTTADGFWNDGDPDDLPNGVQLLQLDEYANAFYAVGSTISSPPMVFIGDTSGVSLDFSIVQFKGPGQTSFNGVLWDMDVNAEGIIAGGVNLDSKTGILYSHPNDGSSDITSADTWTTINLRTLFPDRDTWVQGVCRTPGALYAVGTFSGISTGFVLRSTDGGQHFTDITPYENSGASSLKALSACQAFGQGLVVAGETGQFATFIND